MTKVSALVLGGIKVGHTPVLAFERTHHTRTSDVPCIDCVKAFEVGDGAGHAQYTVVSSCRKTVQSYRTLEYGPTAVVYGTESAYQVAIHLCIAMHALDVGKTATLDFASGDDACAYLGAAFGRGAVGEGIEVHRLDLNVQVNAIEQGSRNTVFIA